MRHFPAALALVAAVTAWGCASQLKRDLTDNAPEGKGLWREVDPASLTFRRVGDGGQISAAEYMEKTGKKYLLLTFGSVGCSDCMTEARHLKHNVIGEHELYLTDKGRKFEIIGVNTDSRPYDNKMKGFFNEYSFVKWSDTGGDVMVDYFMPKGRKFAVPLTALVTRKGIRWVILPEDFESVDQIMGKVSASLNLDEDGASGGGDGGTDGGDGDDDGSGQGDGDDGGDGGGKPAPTGPLSRAVPGRLADVQVTSCQGKTQSLQKALGRHDFRFVQVAKGACEGACRKNRKALARARAACEQSAGRDCAAVTLVTEGDIPPELCDEGHVYQGGERFYEVFRTHFDWAYRPVEGPDWLPQLQEVQGPLVFGFRRNDGRLVYSHDSGVDGPLGGGALVAAMKKPDFERVARGPDFKLWTKEEGEFRFADWRRQARYTVVAAWGAYPVPCGSCIEELKRWSAEGGLVDFCAARPDQCQMMAMETHLPEEGQSMEAFFNGILHGDGGTFEGLRPQGITAPLALDPVPLRGPDGDEYLDRFFDGYMVASKPEWDFEYRTVIYDREGKALKWFRAEGGHGPDPVLKTLKKLLDR